MNKFLKIIGYVLIVIFCIDLIYIIVSGFSPGNRGLQDVIWHLFWAAGMVVLGIWLIGRLKVTKQPDGKPGVLGVTSLVIGIIGILWWPSVMGLIAVLLAILQFRKHASKTAIAGLCMGIIDFILAVIWFDLGLMPSIF